MKKVIILFVLLFIPIMFVGAKCDTEKHSEYIKYASNVTYKQDYSKSKSKFTITLYNVVEGLTVKYNKGYYDRRSDDTVVIDNISEGTYMSIELYSDDECGPAGYITIELPYFNQFYDSPECMGYKDKINNCSYQFTHYKVTKELLDLSIANLKPIKQREEKKEVEEKSSLTIIMDFMLNWGIKILLLIITCIVSIAYYNTKFRKIKHGI